MSEENFDPINPSNYVEDSVPMPESEYADEALARQKALEQLNRVATDPILGGMLGNLTAPPPAPASEIGPSFDQNQYTNDAFYPNDLIEEESLNAENDDPADYPENALKRPMWEILKAEDGNYTIEPGVIFWNEYNLFYDTSTENIDPVHLLPVSAIAIKYDGGDAPIGGDYIYAAVPVQPTEIDGLVYYEYAGGGVTVMALNKAPDEQTYDDGSFYVPIGRIERSPTVDPDTGEETPGSGKITQYLEGAVNFDVGIYAREEDNFTHPFRLIRVDEETWRIETDGSSITNDADGTEITIAGLSDNYNYLGYVYVQCGISGTGEPTGTATIEIEPNPLDEIELNGSDQDYANLLIGKVYTNSEGDDIDISQAYNNAALLSRLFVSGSLRWGFIAHPSHPDSLEAGN